MSPSSPSSPPSSCNCVCQSGEIGPRVEHGRRCVSSLAIYWTFIGWQNDGFIICMHRARCKRLRIVEIALRSRAPVHTAIRNHFYAHSGRQSTAEVRCRLVVFGFMRSLLTNHCVMCSANIWTLQRIQKTHRETSLAGDYVSFIFFLLHIFVLAVWGRNSRMKLKCEPVEPLFLYLAMSES